MSKNFIGLEKESLENVVKELNVYLANLNTLYTKIHNLHWNVEGPAFFQLHSKFEEFYNGISEDLDAVAERILILGFRPAASLKEYLGLTTIKELDSKGISGDESINILQEDFTSMVEHSRKILTLAEDAKDQGTIDLIAGFISNYEKALWMISSYKAK